MKKRLFEYALLSSPIIAVYGISPLYIFDKISLHNAILLVFGLTIHVFIFWLINIVLHHKISYDRKWLIYILSFVIVFLVQIPKIFIDHNLPFLSMIDKFIVYPIINTVAINTIILIICNSVVLEEKKKSAEIEIEQLQVEKLEAQKQILIQQLQPHFLFNSLSVLKSLIKENADTAEEYTIKLSEFLRYSIESHKEDVVLLRNELQFVSDYIELQKVRFEDSFVFEVDIPDAILNHKMPVFALQTLVENAFKHNHFTEIRPLSISVK